MALQIICESQSESQETVSVLDDAMRSGTIKQFLGDFQSRSGKTAEKERNQREFDIENCVLWGNTLCH